MFEPRFIQNESRKSNKLHPHKAQISVTITISYSISTAHNLVIRIVTKSRLACLHACAVRCVDMALNNTEQFNNGPLDPDVRWGQ